MISCYMDEDTKKIIESFSKITHTSFKSERKGNTAIGKTLEDILSVKENNFNAPDLHNFEIKSHGQDSKSYCTLFTKSATSPRAANTMLRKKYGTPDSIHPEVKVLHTSIFANKWTTNKLKEYEFKLRLSDKKNQVELLTKSCITNKYEVSAIWTYESLKKTMFKKMKKLAYIKAKKIKNQDHDEYFEYLSMQLFFDLDFTKFLKLLKEGKICFDLRMGAYKTGKKKGKSHDHGSGFRIKEKDIKNLYSHSYLID